jgi:hypothetical protein
MAKPKGRKPARKSNLPDIRILKMVKREGRKPSKDSNLPAPEVWRWCKHPECMKRAQNLAGFGGENEQLTMRELSHLCAVFLEDYCWRHLNEEARSNYKAKIEKWVMEGYTLQEANLCEVSLQEAYLVNANLQGVDLMYARLQKARLFFADLKESDLWGAKLQGADLRGAYLQEAELRDSKLDGASLQGVLWDDARNLTWGQIKKTGEEAKSSWTEARDAYRLLKNYFHQQGKYDDEAQAYYRERLMAQRQAWKEKKLGKWFVLFLLNILAGFGEKLWRTVVGAFATILIFSGIYWLAGKLVTNGGEPITKFWHCLYFSVVTFATLGFGDISPALHSTGTQVAVVIEVILGYVFLGTLITIIARKFGR